MTNLHDVQTRFQRLVGELPAENLAMPEIVTSLIPEDRQAVLNRAYDRSPEINAAIENLRSTQSALNSTNAPMMPRLDLRYRNQVEHDTDGFEGRFDEEAVELVLTYNLYRGGADSARKRQFNNLYYSAVEERKQACLNVRQQTLIAHNEISALEEQLTYLDQSMLSQDRTRKAYNDQFDLGQRTLLDLLDSQNEYFDTQRSFYSARTGLLEAKARTLANMGLLLTATDVEGLNADKIRELELDFDRGEDENGLPLCPPEAAEPPKVDKDALFAALVAGDYRNNRSSDGGSDTDIPVVALAAGGAAVVAASRYSDAGENRVSLEVNVQFEHNSSIIADCYDEEIINSAAFLADHPAVKAMVEGHTDSTGTAKYNQWLSEKRARAVRNMLINDHGVSPEQVTASGYGQNRPLASNDTESGREQNRRVELVLDGN